MPCMPGKEKIGAAGLAEGEAGRRQYRVLCEGTGGRFLARKSPPEPLRGKGGIRVAKGKERQDQRQALQKRVALKEDGYYSNCVMVETTPFDIAILFGKVRPFMDQGGQASLVEMYDRQVYLSHLQARALYEALGRSLGSLSRPAQKSETKESKPEGVVQERA